LRGLREEHRPAMSAVREEHRPAMSAVREEHRPAMSAVREEHRPARAPCAKSIGQRVSAGFTRRWSKVRS
jgi:hypothetical protein